MKKILPKSLLARFICIFFIPFVLVQVMIAVLYFGPTLNRLVATSANDLASEVTSLYRLAQSYPKKEIYTHAHILQWRMKIHPKQPIASYKGTHLHSHMLDALKKKIPTESFSLKVSHKWIRIVFPMHTQWIELTTSRQRLYNKSMYQMFIWSILSSLVLMGVAVGFMRNQVRPIKRLAMATEAFGQGDDVEDFSPSGAQEVRQAGYAFLKMKEQLNRYMSERLDMLSHISHDLRTPLTRMRLQLSLMQLHKGEKDALLYDIQLMQTYVESFLDFAHRNITENRESIFLAKIIDEQAKLFSNKSFHIQNRVARTLIFPLKPLSFKRLLSNIMDNASRFSTEFYIDAFIDPQGALVLTFSDNGPGIPEEKYDQVFLPFIKIDYSRSQEAPHSGLGLSIVKDIVLNHGGDIYLQPSPQGGLSVVVQFPKGIHIHTNA
jgi:two-component system osmolarity sensor histidine kinase EnvZ